jgi:hypothetical protein
MWLLDEDVGCGGACLHLLWLRVIDIIWNWMKGTRFRFARLRILLCCAGCGVFDVLFVIRK